MSQTSIGRAALILTTNGSGLRSGLDAERAHLQQWAAATATAINGKMKEGAAKGAGESAGWVSALKGIGGKALGAAAAVGTLALAGQELRDIAKEGAAASAFGLSAEQFTGMAGVAKSVGGDTREFIESLVTLQKLGSEGAAGAGEVAPQFFKQLNLDAKEFNGLRADEQFYRVFEAISTLEQPGQRVRALMTAFGEDGGKNLLPLLEKTPDQLRKMADGFKISSDEMAKAKAGSQAMAQAQQALGKTWRTIAVGLTPIITTIAVAVERLRPAFDWVGRFFGELGTVGGIALDGIGQGLSALGEWFNELAGSVGAWTGTWPTVQEVVVEVFRAIGIVGGLAWDTIKAGAGAVVVVAGLAVKGFALVVSTLADVIKMGQKLPSAIRPDWIDEAAAAVDGFSGRVNRASDDMINWGKGAVTGFGSSAVQFNMWLDKSLEKSKQKTAEAGAAAVATAQAVAGELKKVDNEALLRGSKAEVTARLKYELGAQSGPQKQLVDEQKKGNGFLARIEAAARELVNKPAAPVPVI